MNNRRPFRGIEVAKPCSHNGPKFRSMEITQRIRDYAEKLGLDAETAKKQRMGEMSEMFQEIVFVGDILNVAARQGGASGS